LIVDALTIDNKDHPIAPLASLVAARSLKAMGSFSASTPAAAARRFSQHRHHTCPLAATGSGSV